MGPALVATRTEQEVAADVVCLLLRNGHLSNRPADVGAVLALLRLNLAQLREADARRDLGRGLAPGPRPTLSAPISSLGEVRNGSSIDVVDRGERHRPPSKQRTDETRAREAAARARSRACPSPPAAGASGVAPPAPVAPPEPPETPPPAPVPLAEAPAARPEPPVRPSAPPEPVAQAKNPPCGREGETQDGGLARCTLDYGHRGLCRWDPEAPPVPGPFTARCHSCGHYRDERDFVLRPGVMAPDCRGCRSRKRIQRTMYADRVRRQGQLLEEIGLEVVVGPGMAGVRCRACGKPIVHGEVVRGSFEPEHLDCTP